MKPESARCLAAAWQHCSLFDFLLAKRAAVIAHEFTGQRTDDLARAIRAVSVSFRQYAAASEWCIGVRKFVIRPERASIFAYWITGDRAENLARTVGAMSGRRG